MTYSKLNLEPLGTEKVWQPYQQFYQMTQTGEKMLAHKLKNDLQQVIACKKRLEELESLLKHGEDRCHASRDQRNFLRRMLLPY